MPFMPTMQQLAGKRIVIYAKDIMNITGRKERAARKLLAKIKKKYDKDLFLEADQMKPIFKKWKQ